MPFLIILGVLMLLVAVLLLQWVTLIIEYKNDISCILKISFVKFDLLHLNKNKGKKKKKKKFAEKSEAAPSEGKKKKAQTNREKLSAVISVLEIASEILPKFLGRMHIKAARVNIVIGGEDASHVAMLCGTAKAVTGVLLQSIDNWCILDKGYDKSVSILPNFLSEESTYDLKLRFRIRIVSALPTVASFFAKFIIGKIKEEIGKGLGGKKGKIKIRFNK